MLVEVGVILVEKILTRNEKFLREKVVSMGVEILTRNDKKLCAKSVSMSTHINLYTYRTDFTIRVRNSTQGVVVKPVGFVY